MTAVNTSGESAASSQATATPVLPVSAPTAPTGLTATAGNAKVMLSWTASAGATSYNVYYGTTTPVTIANGTKVGSISGTGYTVTPLVNSTPYYFVVTAVNAGGESALSNQANATPTNGIMVALTPGSAASGKLPATSTTSLTYNFGATAVSQNATVTITPIAQADLPTPMAAKSKVNGHISPMVQATDTFIAAFELSIDPPSILVFNIPINISGNVDGSLFSSGTTLNLAILQNGVWVDDATFLVGANGAFTENLASVDLAGLFGPGKYLLYKPTKTTSVSNLGVALMADDGYGLYDGSNYLGDGLQVIQIYDRNGNLLATPTISNLIYSGMDDLDGQAMTPDGSQGIMVDGDNYLSFFSAV